MSVFYGPVQNRWGFIMSVFTVKVFCDTIMKHETKRRIIMLDKYKGIFPAFYACYDDEGNVSAERTKALVELLIEKGVSGQKLCDIIAKAQETRANGTQVLVARMNKNKKFQKEQLMAEGYEEFEEFYKEELKK